MPRLWGSRSYGNGNSKTHPYDHSHSGNFALKTFGQGSERDQKRTMNDMTEFDSHSEEAIISSKGRTGNAPENANGVMMSTEFTMEVSESNSIDTEKEGGGGRPNRVVSTISKR